MTDPKLRERGASIGGEVLSVRRDGRARLRFTREEPQRHALALNLYARPPPALALINTAGRCWARLLSTLCFLSRLALLIVFVAGDIACSCYPSICQYELLSERVERSDFLIPLSLTILRHSRLQHCLSRKELGLTVGRQRHMAPRATDQVIDPILERTQAVTGTADLFATSMRAVRTPTTPQQQRCLRGIAYSPAILDRDNLQRWRGTNTQI
jgi:hypothetical protein